MPTQEEADDDEGFGGNQRVRQLEEDDDSPLRINFAEYNTDSKAPSRGPPSRAYEPPSERESSYSLKLYQVDTNVIPDDYNFKLLKSIERKAAMNGGQQVPSSRNSYAGESPSFKPGYTKSYNTGGSPGRPLSQQFDKSPNSYNSPKRARSPMKEKYQDYIVRFGIIKEEETDLDMSPNGKKSTSNLI